VSAAEYCPLFLTSILKNMNIAVFDQVSAVVDGSFTGGLYGGTLENGGVGIAEYHEFDASVPQELKDAITELQAGIIDGSVSVNPADYASALTASHRPRGPGFARHLSLLYASAEPACISS
jgi:basic membrane protein A